jgi:U3 small nucleolar RNA-associated protein 25
MTTAAEVKLLTLLNVSAIKRPRELDLPGGFRSPGTSRPQSHAGSPAPAEPQPKRRRSVVFGGEVGPSGSSYGKKPSKKASKLAAAAIENGDADDAEIEEEEEEEVEAEVDSDNEDEDTFLTHFGSEPELLYGEVPLDEAVKEGRWETSRTSVSGLGRVVEQHPAGGSRAEGKTRVSSFCDCADSSSCQRLRQR